MSFPITIGNKVFTLEDFAALAYVTGIPDSIEAIGNLASLKLWSTSTSVVTTDGVEAFTLDTPIAANVGDSLFFLDLDSDLATMPTYTFGTVTSYDGELALQALFSLGSVISSNWLIMVRHDSGFVEPCSVSSHQGVAPNLPGTWVNAPDIWTAPFDSLPVALLSPWPSGGLFFVDDFQGAVGTSQYNYGPWSVLGSGAFTFNTSGHSVFTTAERGQSQQGVWQLTLSTATDKASMRLGNRGYISAYVPGDLFAAWAVMITPDVGPSGDRSVYVGLRGDASEIYGDIFSAYGIGFEVVCVGTVKSIYGVVTKNGDKTRVFLTTATGELGYYLIYVDRYQGMIYLKYTEDTISVGEGIEFPDDPTTYPMQVSLKEWPDDRTALLHPAVSLLSKDGSGTFGVYPERVFFFKQLER